MKNTSIQYHSIAVFDIDILYAIATTIDKKFDVLTPTGEVYTINAQSLRYKVFKNNLSCSCCGITGSKMVLEKPAHDPSVATPHLNLYAIDEHGEMIMMTKDHIIPKSKGGKDGLYNLETMCRICNEVKGNQDLSKDELKILVNEFKEKRKKIQQNQ